MRAKLLPQFMIGQEQVQLSARNPVRAQDLHVVQEVLPHGHEFFEISIIHGGEGLHITRNGAEPIRAGHVLIMAPGEVHGFREVRNLLAWNVYYLSEWLMADLRALWDQDGLVPLFLGPSLFQQESTHPTLWTLSPNEIQHCLHECRHLADEGTLASPSLIYLKSALLKLLTLLSRAYVHNHPGGEVFPYRQEAQLGLDYMETLIHQGRPFESEGFARACRLSERYAARLFKVATGSSPRDYYQRRRVMHASLLLLHPGRTISEVAHELGYADAAHLSRMFRTVQGTSPRQYRQCFGAPE